MSKLTGLKVQIVSCFRWLFSDFWLRRPGFLSSLVHGNFVVNKLEMEHVFIMCFCSPCCFILPVLRIYLFIHPLSALYHPSNW